eukprot:1640431-Pleurochrysis_carterae.AAC.1
MNILAEQNAVGITPRTTPEGRAFRIALCVLRGSRPSRSLFAFHEITVRTSLYTESRHSLAHTRALLTHTTRSDVALSHTPALA